MLFSWSKFLASLYRSTISCLFRWLSIRGFRPRPSSPLISQPNTEPVVSRNRKRLNYLQEGSDGSPGDEERCNLLDSPIQDLDLEGLSDEAKLLKACGTIPETPAEIRKASTMLSNSSPNGVLDSSKFYSWLPETQNLNMEMEPYYAGNRNKQCEDCVGFSGSSAHEPNNCIKIGKMISTSVKDSAVGEFGTTVHVYADDESASAQSRNKSVRFNCPLDTSLSSLESSSSGASRHSLEKSESPGDKRASKLSPYPTPLKLTDDMQTPGTVFPSYIGNIVVGKNPRIRTQYVQSVVNQVEDSSHPQGWREDESTPDQQSAHLINRFELANIATPNSEVRKADIATPDSEVRMLISSDEEDMKVKASLLSCIKPLPSNQCANNQWVVTFASEDNYFGQNPGDRPILGTVASHWNEDESPPLPPKSWDGNGIPNSTTKYKEDQKVCWHATPFEERLEKALSEKHIIYQRRNLNGTPPLDLN
ncbi:Aspartyl/glutamyl-tRNA(Asn/Gln) amidotransferase subunit [Heracleum sosnowskyi]|uniref:Aspartyl/glutamyl-tRNA(Asn/Gln) amidotransferase subunit n=1 Tax=Heracleum sosnowskyi TaxID=360622 RepID=A0AAD8IWI4_9APIA|nr:Aspartyl/glutamyl-tRNA(Asn/Gln) amidotransferase subunit [Heracleum sosnowskyi]